MLTARRAFRVSLFDFRSARYSVCSCSHLKSEQGSQLHLNTLPRQASFLTRFAMIFKRPASVAVILAALALSAVAQTKPGSQSAAQSSSAASPQDQQLLSKVESYLRVLFAWGPDYQIKLGPAKPTQIPGLDEVPVQVNHEGHSETGTVYVTKDGRYMFRGEIRDLAVDPFAENRAKLKISDAPSLGPADAKVTVVEFSD